MLPLVGIQPAAFGQQFFGCGVHRLIQIQRTASFADLDVVSCLQRSEPFFAV